jgi:hypothetical protein
MQVLEIKEKAEHDEFKMIYLQGDSIQLRLALKNYGPSGCLFAVSVSINI